MKIFAILMAILSTMSKAPMSNIQNVEIYAKTTVVIEVDYEMDAVTVADMMQRTWRFIGCEDWMEGDIASLLMSDNGTPENCYDDVIIDARYDGWIDDYENWFYRD